MLSIIFFFVSVLPVKAGPVASIDTTVKTSFCGYPYIVEGGEDCENTDMQGYSCQSLGYSAGNLSCDVSCSFDTSDCTIPSIDSSNVASTEVSSLLAAGYVEIPLTASIVSTPYLTVATPITISISAGGGDSDVSIPEGVVITESGGRNFNPTDLTASLVSVGSLSGFSSSVSAAGSLQWGIAGSTLVFSEPITLSVYVGTSLNDKTLNVYRSHNVDSGWTNDGIESPATCNVSAGICTFQATKASYFAVVKDKDVSSSSSSTTSNTSSSTSTSTSNTSSAANLPVITIPLLEKLFLPVTPDVLRFYTDYLDGGKIKQSELFRAIGTWVDDWKQISLAINRGEDVNVSESRCDLNKNNECDLKDLSILLFYVEK